MGLDTLQLREIGRDGGEIITGYCFFDRTKGRLFGPLFAYEEEPDDFVRWFSEHYDSDLREQSFDALSGLLRAFRAEQRLSCATARPHHEPDHLRWYVADSGRNQSPVEIRPSNIDTTPTEEATTGDDSCALALVEFLRERNNAWRSFTLGEFYLWTDAKRRGGAGGLVTLVSEGLLKFAKAPSGRPGLTEETVVHILDKFILTLFCARGILKRS